nr:hypothetical protein [uncultured Treponema sp.]
MSKNIICITLISILFCACSKNDLRQIEKMLNNGEIDKIEKLIQDNKVENVERVRNMIFEKQLTEIVIFAKKNDIEKIKAIINENNFTQEQYNIICERIYNVFNSYLPIMKLINTKISPDTYCFDDTLLMAAIKTQRIEYVRELLLKGADTKLRNKKGWYNALFLSISFNTENSVEIFKEVMSKTEIKEDDNFKFPPYTLISGWYFEQLILFNQEEMMNLFLQKSDVIKMITDNKMTLEILANNLNAFDIVPDSIIEADLYIDKEHDCFLDAIVSYNYKILPILISKKIHPYCKGYDSFIKDFISDPHSRKIDLFELDNGSEEYNKIIEMAPLVKDYYEKWEKNK